MRRGRPGDEPESPCAFRPAERREQREQEQVAQEDEPGKLEMEDAYSKYRCGKKTSVATQAAVKISVAR